MIHAVKCESPVNHVIFNTPSQLPISRMWVSLTKVFNLFFPLRLWFASAIITNAVRMYVIAPYGLILLRSLRCGSLLSQWRGKNIWSPSLLQRLLLLGKHTYIYIYINLYIYIYVYLSHMFVLICTCVCLARARAALTPPCLDELNWGPPQFEYSLWFNPNLVIGSCPCALTTG